MTALAVQTTSESFPYHNDRRQAVRIAQVKFPISERTLYALTKANKLPHKRLGGRVVYSIEALKRFVNESDTQE